MAEMTTQKQQQLLYDARESWSGRLQTDRKFEQRMAYLNIIENEIKHAGTFKKTLNGVAYMISQAENREFPKVESELRDLFSISRGQTMYKMQQEAVARDKGPFTDEQRQTGYQRACEIGTLVENGTKMSFNRAVGDQAKYLAMELGITDTGAKNLMTEEFRAAEGIELFEWGRELDEKYFKPQIEAEKQERENAKNPESNSLPATLTRIFPSRPAVRPKGWIRCHRSPRRELSIT